MQDKNSRHLANGSNIRSWFSITAVGTPLLNAVIYIHNSFASIPMPVSSFSSGEHDSLTSPSRNNTTHPWNANRDLWKSLDLVGDLDSGLQAQPLQPNPLVNWLEPRTYTTATQGSCKEKGKLKKKIKIKINHRLHTAFARIVAGYTLVKISTFKCHNT